MKIPDETTSKTRPPLRLREMLRVLRERIVSGEWSPGARLPTRDALKREFDVSGDTVQAAFRQLVRDGFVESRGRAGTFISPRPAHLSRFALAVPSVPAGQVWPPLWTRLIEAAADVNRSHPARQVHVYHNIDGHADGEDFRQLLRDTSASRLGGVILCDLPEPLDGSPLLDDPSLPRVALTLDRPEVSVPRLVINASGAFSLAAAELARRGGRRLGVIGPLRYLNDDAMLIRLAGEAGLRLEPFWIQRLNHRTPESARGVVHLMMHPDDPDLRPDALYVVNEPHVEPALHGLLDARRTLGRDVHVAAGAVFPIPSAGVLPVVRVGVSARAMLELAVDHLFAMRTGVAPAEVAIEPIIQCPD